MVFDILGKGGMAGSGLLVAGIGAGFAADTDLVAFAFLPPFLGAMSAGHQGSLRGVVMH